MCTCLHTQSDPLRLLQVIEVFIRSEEGLSTGHGEAPELHRRAGAGVPGLDSRLCAVGGPGAGSQQGPHRGGGGHPETLQLQSQPMGMCIVHQKMFFYCCVIVVNKLYYKMH